MVDQFHIIAQVGQGGYGEVFLARKQVRIMLKMIHLGSFLIMAPFQDSGEVCALKKMRKKTLLKMDEVSSLRHFFGSTQILKWSGSRFDMYW